MKISLKELLYIVLLLFIFVAIKVQFKSAYWYGIGAALLVLFIFVDRKYAQAEGKAYLSYVMLITLIIVLLPKISLAALIWVVPGFLLTFLLTQAIKFNFTFKDRIIVGLLFSLLLMLVSVLLSYLGIPVGRMFLIVLFCLPLLVLFVSKYRAKLITKIKSINIDYKTIILGILLLSATLWVYASFLNDALPQTTAVEYFSSGRYVEQSLLENKAFPTWEIKNTLGQARYTLDTPLYFWMSGVTGALVGKGLVYVYNPLFLFLTIFLVMGLYLVFLKLTKNNILAFLGAALFLTAEPIGRAIGASGNMKAFASFALAIIPFYLFVRFKEELQESPSKSDLFFVLMILSSSVALLAHIAPLHILVAVNLMGGILLVKNLIKDRDYLNFKKIFPLIALTALVIIFISFWALPFVKYFYSAISEIDAQLRINLLDYVKSNVPVVVAFLLCIVPLVYFAYKKKEEWSNVLIGLIPLLFIIPYIYEVPVLYHLLDKIKIIEFPKAEIIFFLAVIVVVILFLKNLLKQENKIIVQLGWALTLGCFIFAAISGYQLHNSFGTYVSEEIHTGKLFTSEFNFVKTLPQGNVFTAGVFGLAIDGVVYDFTDHPAIGIGFAGAQEKYIQYRIRMDDGHTIYENSREYVHNIFKLSGVKYLFINRCSPTVNLLMQELFSDSYLKNIEDSEYKLIYAPEKNCMVIFELKNVSFAKRIKLAEIGITDPKLLEDECIRVTHGRCLPNPKYDKLLYNRAGGFEIVWEDVRSSGTASADYVISDINQTIPITKKGDISYIRNSDTSITLNGEMENEWIYVAESYFPRWKAYDATGKELEIRKTNLGTMAIKTESYTKSIKLEYRFPLWEKGLYAMALIAVLIIFLFFFNKKKIIENSLHSNSL